MGGIGGVRLKGWARWTIGWREVGANGGITRAEGLVTGRRGRPLRPSRRPQRLIRPSEMLEAVPHPRTLAPILPMLEAVPHWEPWGTSAVAGAWRVWLVGWRVTSVRPLRSNFGGHPRGW